MARHHIETALAALPVNWKPVSQTLCLRRRRPNYSTHLTASLLSAMDGQMVEVDGIPTSPLCRLVDADLKDEGNMHGQDSETVNRS